MRASFYSEGKAVVFLPLFLLLLAGCGERPATERQNQTAGQAPENPELIENLMDFDSGDLPPGLKLEGASAEPVAGSDDGGALQIVFSAGTYRPTVRLRAEEPWDWSGHDNFHIAIDASNPGDESVQLYLSLTAAAGVTGDRDVSANRAVNIAAGESGTYFVVLDGLFTGIDSGLRENPPPWDTTDEMFNWRFGNKDLDLSAISEIALFVRGTIADKTLVIDNVRLRRNPEHDRSFIEGFVDEFGQNAKLNYPIKITSEQALEAAAAAELAALAASGPLPDRSRFGGWQDGPRRDGTGYFRAEKVDDKWWLIDPDGYLFFSHGLANVRMANLTTLTGIDFRDPSVRHVDPGEVTPEDSIGIVSVSDEARETRYVSSSLRHNMFTWLPEYDHELADHYSFRRSAHRGPLDGGETFSFYRANLERRYGESAPESYVRQWEEVTLSRMLDWGFTSMGNWVDPAFYPNERVAYFANGWIIGDFQTLSSTFDVWAPMPDPFDPEFVRRAELTIDVIADEIQGSPWCVGIFVDNEKSWGYREGTVEQRYGIILDALSRSANDSPAKLAFTTHLRETHGTIETLNGHWQTAFESWDAFSRGFDLAQFTPRATADLSTLLELLSEEYFRVVHDAVAAALPNHLYMGARMANWGMPDETIKAAVKYSDVLSFNIYEEGMQPQAWAFLEEIDLPTIIGEFHVGATRETGLFHPGLVQADGQADRAAMYTAYMESVAALDTMVGAHWFQYVDSPITGRAFDGENYNVGFVTVTDIPYPEMVAAAKAFNTSLYPKRYGDRP